MLINLLVSRLNLSIMSFTSMLSPSSKKRNNVKWVYSISALRIHEIFRSKPKATVPTKRTNWIVRAHATLWETPGPATQTSHLKSFRKLNKWWVLLLWFKILMDIAFTKVKKKSLIMYSKKSDRLIRFQNICKIWMVEPS